jgi:hypothetical protein
MFYTYATQMAKYFDKSTWGYWPSKGSHYAVRNMELSRYRWFDKMFQYSKCSIKATDKTEIKALIGLLCLAGALRSNKQSLEEMWD